MEAERERGSELPPNPHLPPTSPVSRTPASPAESAAPLDALDYGSSLEPRSPGSGHDGGSCHRVTPLRSESKAATVDKTGEAAEGSHHHGAVLRSIVVKPANYRSSYRASCSLTSRSAEMLYANSASRNGLFG